MTIAQNIRFLRGLPKFPHEAVAGFGALETKADRVTRIKSAGTNPGNLAMYAFIPEQLPNNAPLVVVLHGCTQTAVGYDLGTGWSELAERYGFALLMPEQQRVNNANGCFNWFEPEDTKRDAGEVCSIKQMIEQIISQHHLNPDRVFITGLSAGGAMTSAMLATYPEIFAGGAIIAGLPYGVASNLQEALSGMFRSTHRSSSELGQCVRDASNFHGPWPKVSVWHGGTDRTVNPLNSDHIVDQWLDVHDLPTHATTQDLVDGYPHQIWKNSNGESVVESFKITGMAHGAPLGTAEDGEKYGSEGAFLIDAGISSSHHIAKFFALTGSIHIAKPEHNRIEPFPSIEKTVSGEETFSPWERSSFSIGATINKALKAAGLMK